MPMLSVSYSSYTKEGGSSRWVADEEAGSFQPNPSGTRGRGQRMGAQRKWRGGRVFLPVPEPRVLRPRLAYSDRRVPVVRELG